MRFTKQLFPILLSIVTFFILSILLYGFIYFLNLFPIKQKIFPQLNTTDILVGLTIYIKTAIDFAIFIGNLMHRYQGWKNRVSIEMGTSLGNFIGTLFILSIWTFFKEIPLLLIIMIILAAFVLLGMAEEGIEEYLDQRVLFNLFNNTISFLKNVLHTFNFLTSSLLTFALPNHRSSQKEKGHQNLFFYSITIPLLLGLDDFAGYIPLFTIVNVFGFAVGVFLGHMLLISALFASPSVTTKIVKSPFVLLLGSLAFIGIALWGFAEVFHMISLLLFK